MDNSDPVVQAGTGFHSLLTSGIRRTVFRGRRAVDNPQSSASSPTEASAFIPEDAPLLISVDDTENNGNEQSPSDERSLGLPWWKTPSIYWIIPAFLIASLALGGVLAPQLNLILELICRNYIADRTLTDPTFHIAPVIFGEANPQCRTKEVQSRVAQFTLGASAISGILSALIAPKFGALSDQYGRKGIIVLGSFGALCREIIMVCAAKFPDTFPVSVILVGYAIDGLCGSFPTLMAIVHAYATDTTTPENRNAAFGLFHGCLFIGIAIGPLIAAKIIDHTGTVLTVFYIALISHITFIFVFFFIIPESVSKERQLAAREKARAERAQQGVDADWADGESRPIIQYFSILEPLKILYPMGPGSSAAVRRNLLLLSAIDTIIFGVAMGAMTVVIIYVNYQFGWDTVRASIFTSIVNSCRVLGLLCIMPTITWIARRRRANAGSQGNQNKRRGADLLDLNVIRVAVFFDMLGYLGYSFSGTGALFTLSGCIAAAGGVGSPTLQSALTKHVPPDRTGQILGANGLLHALARVAGPTIFSGIYSLTVGKYTQAVFVCLAAAFAMAFVCSWFIRPNVYIHDELEDRHADADEVDETTQRLLETDGGEVRVS